MSQMDIVNGLSHAASGVAYVLPISANVAALMMVKELSLRTVGSLWTKVFGTPERDSFLDKVSGYIRVIRPFGELKGNRDYRISTASLAVRTVGTATFSVLTNVGAYQLCGRAPAIYNYLFDYIGPLRIGSTS